MTASTTDRVALVTGGSGGIGRVVSERLAKDGLAVAVHYAGNRERAEATAEAITSAGGGAVNVVAPGPTATSFFLEGKNEAVIEGLAKSTPLERLGRPEDIAEAVAFLAGPARWINGQVIYANGGLA